MEKLLMLGTSHTSIEIINMAKARGVYTITTDYREPEQSKAKLISDEYWMIDTADVDVLEKKCREEGITAVIAGVSEFNIERMMELCRRLDLPCWCDQASWDAIQKKHLFKKLCRENNVLIPKDYFLSNPPTEEELAGIEYPVVVKPVDQCLSRGISYCHTKEEVIKACEYARSLSKEETVIVEQLVTGDFCMAHCALAETEAELLAVTALIPTKAVPYTSALTVSSAGLRELYEERVMPNLRKLLKAGNCKDGICWTQSFLRDDNNFCAFEMGYRNDGDMMTIPVQHATGFDTMSWLLDTSLGVKHSAQDLPSGEMLKRQKYTCQYTMISMKNSTVSRVEGMELVKQMSDIRVLAECEEGQTILPHAILMRFLFSADTLDDMCGIVEKIGSTVQVYDENGNTLVTCFDNFDGVRKTVER